VKYTLHRYNQFSVAPIKESYLDTFNKPYKRPEMIDDLTDYICDSNTGHKKLRMDIKKKVDNILTKKLEREYWSSYRKALNDAETQVEKDFHEEDEDADEKKERIYDEQLEAHFANIFKFVNAHKEFKELKKYFEIARKFYKDLAG
jgi:hypothetical protein